MEFYDELRKNLLNFSFDDIIGNETVKKQVKSALYARRPIIIVGAPGIGKNNTIKTSVRYSSGKRS